jgi:hypothetical protein
VIASAKRNNTNRSESANEIKQTFEMGLIRDQIKKNKDKNITKLLTVVIITFSSFMKILGNKQEPITGKH